MPTIANSQRAPPIVTQTSQTEKPEKTLNCTRIALFDCQMMYGMCSSKTAAMTSHAHISHTDKTVETHKHLHGTATLMSAW